MFYTVLAFLFVASVSVGGVHGVDCKPGEYKTRDEECCPMCEAGYVVRRDCTPESSTGCIKCGSGTYMDKRNGLTKCLTCTSCHPAEGLLTQQECTPTSNTVCDVVEGHFCKSSTLDTGCTVAEVHRSCAAGQRIKSPGNKTADTVCEDCPPRYYSPYGITCIAWTICSETQRTIEEGSPSKDFVCGNAERHHYVLIASFLLPVIVFGVAISVTRGRRVKRLNQPSFYPVLFYKQ
ncbi:tumor necrosis factor receptor superfamily member 14-like isoform X2 [Myripristis murdjan]|uniref:Tumor necrosis factor receptor superfamily member 14-like n=1 Tax=Myripristis murdjan TaxID=586833 RepID=A0A667WKK7_9TELE|nr:tumor necrosis factor receptor superfamily member 14-like isoform X2 [Myripristis murdjan]